MMGGNKGKRNWEKGTDRFEYMMIVSKTDYVKRVFLYEWDLTTAVLTARTDTPEYKIEEIRRQTQIAWREGGRLLPGTHGIRSPASGSSGDHSVAHVTVTAHNNFRVPNPVCSGARALPCHGGA
jgi:hypothetical protein